MTRRVSILLMAAIALYAASAGAYEVGERIGPVVVHPGGTICDTAEDAVEAIRVFNGTSAPLPESCGFLKFEAPALFEIIGHYENAGQVFAVIKILFLPPAARLGTRFGWLIDHEMNKGAKA